MSMNPAGTESPLPTLTPLTSSRSESGDGTHELGAQCAGTLDESFITGVERLSSLMLKDIADEQRSREPKAEHSPVGPAVGTVDTVTAPIPLSLDDNAEVNQLAKARPYLFLPTVSNEGLNAEDDGHPVATGTGHRPRFPLYTHSENKRCSWADFDQSFDAGYSGEVEPEST